jgi:hypothetical protein
MIVKTEDGLEYGLLHGESPPTKRQRYGVIALILIMLILIIMLYILYANQNIHDTNKVSSLII